MLKDRWSSMPEKEFAEQVVALAKMFGWSVHRTWISIRSPAGFPDLVLVKTGRPLILAELKSQLGRLSRHQKAWIDLFQQVPGIRVFVWRPSQLDQIRDILMQ